jgi:hypothetical protein
MSRERFNLEDAKTEDLVHDLGELIKHAGRKSNHDWQTGAEDKINVLVNKTDSATKSLFEAVSSFTPFLYHALHILFELRRRGRKPPTSQEMKDIQIHLYGHARQLGAAFHTDGVPQDVKFYKDYLIWLEKNNIFDQTGELNIEKAKNNLPGFGNSQAIVEYDETIKKNRLSAVVGSEFKAIIRNNKVVMLPGEKKVKQIYKEIKSRKQAISSDSSEKELETVIDSLYKIKQEIAEYRYKMSKTKSYAVMIENYFPLLFPEQNKSSEDYRPSLIKKLTEIKSAIEANDDENKHFVIKQLKDDIKNNLAKISTDFKHIAVLDDKKNKIKSRFKYLKHFSEKIPSAVTKKIISHIYEVPDDNKSKIFLNLIENDYRLISIKNKINKRLDKIINIIFKQSQAYIKDLENAIQAESAKSNPNRPEINLLKIKEEGINQVITCLKGLNNNDIVTKIGHIKSSIIKLDEYHDILFAKRANRFFDYFSTQQNTIKKDKTLIHEPSDSSDSSSSTSYSTDDFENTDSEFKFKSSSKSNKLKKSISRKERVEQYLNHKPKSVLDFFRPASKGEKLYANIHQIVNKKLLGKS